MVARSAMPKHAATLGMPADKQSTNTPSKPFTPALSTAFRTTRSPLTPKLAGSAQSSPALSPRKGAHTGSVAREETYSPSLNGNITPRSGARRSRIGTESPSSPKSAKQGVITRPRAISSTSISKSVEGCGQSSPGLGISGAGTRLMDGVRPKTAIGNPNVPSAYIRRPSDAKSGLGSEGGRSDQFFHADEAKSPVSSHDLNERPKMRTKAATFYYANGSFVGDGSNAASNQAKAKSAPPSQIEKSKFVHANELVLTKSPTSPLRPLKMSAATTSSPKLSSPETHRRQGIPSRPTSPLKNTSYGSPSPTTAASTAKKVVPTRARLEPKTQSSNTIPLRNGHRKSLSSSSMSSSHPPQTPSPKSAAPPPRHMLITPKSPPTQYVSKPAAVRTSPQPPSPRSTIPIPVSPIHTSHDSKADLPIAAPAVPAETIPATQASQPNRNELAAAARRERKVLDLEISNSSLLAINRTLEREMRKQSVELRRFRRLSRSGRLSMALSGSTRTISGQSMSSLGTVDELDDEELDGADLVDDDDEPSDFDGAASDEDDLSSWSNDSALLSPHSRSLYDMRQRARDEKRLMLDLSKHQQLLVDSQKISQSIRRCMNHTEELIREAKKAVAYVVNVGDVQVGGRVLREDSDDGDEGESKEDEQEESALLSGDEERLHAPREREGSKGLLSPSHTLDLLSGAQLMVHASHSLHGSGQPGPPQSDFASPLASSERLMNH